MAIKVLTCQCVFWPAHMDQKVRSNALQVLFQVLHRLQQELGSVVASLLAAIGCGTEVTWVKAIQWDDLNMSRCKWSNRQDGGKSEEKRALQELITSAACLDLTFVAAAWTVGLSCSLRSSRNHTIMRLFCIASCAILDTLLLALTLRARPCKRVVCSSMAYTSYARGPAKVASRTS